MTDSNISQKLTSFRKSKFRSKFSLSQKDRDYIAAKGLETIKEHAFQFINSRVAPAFPKNDGKQTPMRGHAVFIAQHATATCCRKCIQKWHEIEKGRALNEIKVDYMDWSFERRRIKNRNNIKRKERSLPSFTTVNSPSFV